MLGLGVGLLLLIWAFILGILVGRGYYPEGVLAALGLGDKAQQEQEADNSGSETGPQVLRPEELGFFDALQLEWEQGFQELRPQAEPGARQEQSEPAQEEQSEPAQEEQVQELAQNQEAQAEGQRFAYIYQVAAFQEKAQAKALQEKLSSVQIESYVQDVDKDDQRWYRVYVPHVGTPKENQQLQSELQDLGLDKLFVRSKKPF